jgi:arginyl-tRNA synthetase
MALFFIRPSTYRSQFLSLLFKFTFSANMVKLEEILISKIQKGLHDLYGKEIDKNLIQVQKTRKEFKGDFTIVVFPFLRYSGQSPQETANRLGHYLVNSLNEISVFNVINGFLNLEISPAFWLSFLNEVSEDNSYGTLPLQDTDEIVMVEYSSPNTNKPLHLGHIRNNLLGFSIARILEANGNKVVKVNLVNDRGIHICKSMLAYKLWGGGETPGSSETKGDHLVGKYYIKFDSEYKKEVEIFVEKGLSREEAEKRSGIMAKAREMLIKWENGDKETIDLWKTMNGWVYDGFKATYDKLGVEFDRIYYESDTYSLGKHLVNEGLKTGALYKKEDGSVWIDLTDSGLDHKLILRSDGTSVYITQDIGTARQRFSEYKIRQHIYVVGNEQNYHFQVLSFILKKLGYDWYNRIYHLSYGMVELPEGKMKSREGKVVDADDLIDEMISTAKQMSQDLGKLGDYPEDEKERIYSFIGLGALKYFILKVDPKKNMMFDPKESIDFNGNTGPFIQYTYTRIQSVLRKASEIKQKELNDTVLNEKEVSLLKMIYEFPEVVKAAGATLNPALIANHLYELAREYNQFYHDYSILSAQKESQVTTRLMLSETCSNVIKKGMYMLGIDVPERM